MKQLKKYKIFISSTFVDLERERQELIKACLDLEQIPTGMERFGAASIAQWEIIKRQIDACDYYVVIIAHRYGSEYKGRSFTEREYRYAIRKKIPTLAFLLDERVTNWPPEYYEVEPKRKERLSDFKRMVRQNPVAFWQNTADLVNEFKDALRQEISQDARPGWIRGTGIESGISKASSKWTLCFIGEEQGEMLKRLCADLSRGHDEQGNGKVFDSGFAYWGIVPTLNWIQACRDPNYHVMRQTIDSFRGRLQRLPDRLIAGHHYVSLGVGTGEKDASVLEKLRSEEELFYFPVDMSPEMLREGCKEVSDRRLVENTRLLPVQIDFSKSDNISELKKALGGFVRNEPILFSLLGNTLANFGDDIGTLRNLTELLRPQDKILIEVATTQATTIGAAQDAANEYKQSEHFKQFATSGLLQYTDLPIEPDWLDVLPSIDNGSIMLKVIYRNLSDRNICYRLPKEREQKRLITFRPNDTIRLILTRKYKIAALRRILSEVGLAFIGTFHDGFSDDPNGPDARFGSCIALLERH